MECMENARRGKGNRRDYLRQAEAIQGMALGFVVRMNNYLGEMPGNKPTHEYSLEEMWKRTVPLDGVKPTFAKGDPTSGILHLTEEGRAAERRERARLARLTLKPTNPTRLAETIRAHEKKTGQKLGTDAEIDEDRPLPKERPAFSYLKGADKVDAIPKLEQILKGQQHVLEAHERALAYHRARDDSHRSAEYARLIAEQQKHVDATASAIRKLKSKSSGKSHLPKPALPSQRARGARKARR